MRSYNITITADRWPTTYVVQASDWPTAIARAVREWKKRFRGSRTGTLSIRAVKADELPNTTLTHVDTGVE